MSCPMPRLTLHARVAGVAPREGPVRRLAARTEGLDKSCTETHCPWLTGFVFPASGCIRLPRRCTAKFTHAAAYPPIAGSRRPRTLRNPRGSYPFRTGRTLKMHPRGLEPPARRRAFPVGCKRAPTALRRSFTGSCWPRRLLSVTTFRADVAPPHVGSPSVHARVAGMAKKGGSLPAVALSSREARGTAPCNAPRSVRPVFLGAALVGWCQTMNMAARAGLEPA